MVNNSPTSHPDVNKIIDILFANGKEILNDQFVGMYLFGSLANGDFDQHSDIDILFITKNILPDEMYSALYEMHERISAIDSPWAIQLEVSYIPQDALRRYDTSNNKHPHLERGPGGKLKIRPHEADWIVCTQRLSGKENLR